MYYIRLFLYDIVNVSLRFSQCYFTKCIGYNVNCIGAIMKSNQIGNNTNCSFPGLTHISDKISRYCKQLTKAKYSLQIVHWVTHSNINANKFNLTKSNSANLKNKICCTPWFWMDFQSGKMLSSVSYFLRSCIRLNFCIKLGATAWWDSPRARNIFFFSFGC